MQSPSSQDAAVSPAIGTILLVALTVVFVAVAAVVAMGLADGLFDTKQVGLTLEPYGIASESERGISLTVHGGTDAGDLVTLGASMSGGREMLYRETGKSSVENPVVGTGYRFKADDRETISSTRGNKKLPATLKTDRILSVPEATYFVTVTGKFRDGMEQVLLVQRVTLPAISEKGTITDKDGKGFVIIPYNLTSDSGGYPGHGFTLVIPEGTTNPDKWAKSVTFTITDKDGKTVILSVGKGLTMSQNVDEKGNPIKNSYSFDINPGIMGEDDIPGDKGWENTPFPEKDTTKDYWALGTLTGTVTATHDTDTIVVNDVKIETRVNYFEGLDVGYTLTATSVDNNGIYTLQSSKSSENSQTYKGISYVVKGSDGSYIQEYTYIGDQTLNGGDIKWDKDKKANTLLNDYTDGEVLEVYVKENIGGTSVWHKIYDTPIADLRSTLPTP